MDAIYRFDYSILNYINENMHTPFFDKFFAIITHLADAGWFWIALAVVLLCFKRTRKTGLVMGGALVLGLIFGNGILKPLINRIRPYASFPSGHTLASFEGAFGIFLCNKKWGIPALVLALLIAFSRLYFFIHYPTDVFGGLVLGIGFAVVSFCVMNVLWKKIPDKVKNLGI